MRTRGCRGIIIPLNECPALPLCQPREEGILLFQKILMEAGYVTIIRERTGGAISAACGRITRS
jgi:23S rRNA (adenine2503-C2)-methyltransferase